MAAPTFTNAPSGQVPCSYHPDVQTGLRCTRCGKPICPRCAVRTPVGLRCPDCAGVRGLPTYRTPANDLVKAAGAGLVIAVVVGVLWAQGPEWGFYLSLILGFGVVEAISDLAHHKRGADLMLLAMGMITVGLVLSRVLLAQRYGITLSDLNSLSPAATRLLHLRLVPDIVYAALPYLIAWVRFR